MQEDTARVVREKTALAEHWHAEAARLHASHAAAAEEQSIREAAERGQAEELERLAAALTSSTQELAAARTANDRLSRGMLQVGVDGVVLLFFGGG